MVQQRLGEDFYAERETLARLRVAELNQQNEHIQRSLAVWQEYVTHLERLREIERELMADARHAANGHVEVNQGERQQLSVTDMLLYFTLSQPNRQVANRVATDWAVREHLYPDHDSARAGVASTFGHRITLWRRLRKGQYTLTGVGTRRAEAIARQMQPHLPHPQPVAVGPPRIT